jgi:hypothetical protein
VSIVPQLVERTGALAEHLTGPLAASERIATEILVICLGLPERVAADLAPAAKRLRENVSPDVEIYTVLGDWTRALLKQVEATGDPDLSMRFRSVWIAVMGD